MVSVRGELADGERVITSSIATPIEGMPVRVLEGAVGTNAGDDDDNSESM